MKRKEVRPEFHRRSLSKTLRLCVEQFSALDSLSEDANLAPPLSTSCSPVTISILERSENCGQILANVSGEHEAKGGTPEFHRRSLSKTLRLCVEQFSALDSLSEDANLAPPLSTSCSPVTISILERSENFGQI